MTTFNHILQYCTLKYSIPQYYILKYSIVQSQAWSWFHWSSV